MLLIILINAFSFITNEIPVEKQEIKKSLCFLSNNAKLNLAIYMHHKSILSYSYYSEIGFATLDNNIILGKNDSFKKENLEKKIKSFDNGFLF